MSTNIAWTEETWNAMRGCSRVSNGCVNCYAERTAWRHHSNAYRDVVKWTSHGPAWTGVIVLDEKKLLEPLRWRKPRLVFVNSMSDVFHDALADVHIDRLFAVMALCSQHRFQILTKRPERMRRYLCVDKRQANIEKERVKILRGRYDGIYIDTEVAGGGNVRLRWPLPNVHLGVSCEDQATAIERIPLLLDTPAALRFVSIEPLLGPIDLIQHMPRYGKYWDWLTGDEAAGKKTPAALDWVIVGGESGPHHRPCDVRWIGTIAAQCKSANVPVFVKQDSGSRPGQQGRIPDELWALKEIPQ